MQRGCRNRVKQLRFWRSFVNEQRSGSYVMNTTVRVLCILFNSMVVIKI